MFCYAVQKKVRLHTTENPYLKTDILYVLITSWISLSKLKGMNKLFCSISLLSSHLSAHIDWDADDHRWDGDAGDESDAHGRSDQRAELPEDLLLPAPGLLPPEGAA